MTGKIIKGIAGFYYVHVPEQGIYECKAKGVFRNKKIKPLVGDNVEIEVLDEDKKIGNMTDIKERANQLVRPAVANIDQALIIFATLHPNPNFNLLDRFLLIMSKQQVKTMICFNKMDMVDEKVICELKEHYEACDNEVIFTSTYTKEGIDFLKEKLKGKTTALAGPSGVGKSSILNALASDMVMQTGEISEKIKRGKHTTRHSELIHIEGNTYIMDTPGFSSLYIDEFDKEELKDYFTEFLEYSKYCKFAGCVHISEPDCKVKEALSEGKINQIRYDNYLEMYQELKDKRRW
ncbi:MAG: ribosome small subunit-dependent GTPase A [Lachnospiraceae bacterium]|nr:ribosome small subunit-dependent GTPase A [Lachnospiraceae bacterium]